LAAAEQPCAKCGRTLMGPMGSGSCAAMSGGSGGEAPAWQEPGTRNLTGLWFGMFAGMVAGVGLVALVGFLGGSLPLPVRGAILGALMGVLLAPFLLVFSFVSMFLPWSLDSVIGDAMWTRIATGVSERRLGPFVMPLLVLVVLPMAACAFGGSRMAAITNPMLISASIGAIMLGAILGGVIGSRR
jgi:hypothetical protein